MIKDAVSRQLNAIIYQKPGKGITPDRLCHAPPDGRHQESIYGNKSGHDLRADNPRLAQDFDKSLWFKKLSLLILGYSVGEVRFVGRGGRRNAASR